MKISLRNLQIAYTGLKNIFEEKMPPRMAYIMKRNIKLVEPEVMNFYTKVNELRKEYKEKLDSNANSEEAIKEFNDAVEEILDLEFELDLHIVQVEEISFPIKPKDMLYLENAGLVVGELEL